MKGLCRFRTLVAAGWAVAAWLTVPSPRVMGSDASLPAAGYAPTLAEAIRTAFSNNPMLRAELYRADALLAQEVSAGALPNPVLSVSAEDAAADYRFDDAAAIMLGVEQMIPAAGTRDLRRRIAVADSAAGRHAADVVRLDLVRQITEAAHQLDAALRSADLLRSEERLLTEWERSTSARYAAGTADPLELVQVQSETTLLQQRLTDLQGQTTSLKARINTLLGRAADAVLDRVDLPPVPPWPAPDLSNWLARAENENPDLARAGAMLDKARLEMSLARRETWPDLSLMAEVSRMREDETLVKIGIGVELPLQVPALRAGVREASAREQAAAAEQDAVRRETAWQIQDTASCCASAWQNLESLRTRLLPQADARYRAAESAYAAGRADFAALLESQRFRLNARAMVIAMETEVAIQLARLERLLGGALPTAPRAPHGEGQ